MRLRCATCAAVAATAVMLLVTRGGGEGLRPNELGRVLILEYHRIDDTEGPWTRTPEHVRDDLESLYTRGYRLISLREATSSGLRYWLDELDRRPRGRFVSDGDADAVTIPAGAAAQLRRPLAPGLRVIEAPP